jgi:hypothetical protein
MACSDPLKGVTCDVPKADAIEDEENLIEGIVEGLKDFAKGRYTVFEDDDELEAHLMSL